MSSDEIRNVLVQNRLLTEEIRRRVNQLSAINSVAAMVSQSLDLTATLESALDSVLQVIAVEAAAISLIDHEAGETVMRAQRGLKGDFVSKPMRVKLGQGLSGLVIQNDDVVVTGEVSGDSRIIVPAFTEEHIQAMALAPMHARGRIIGIVSVMSYKPYRFLEEEMDVLKAIADQLGVAIDNAQLYEDTRAKQSRLSAVINSTADAIIAVNSEGIITLVNSAAENLFDTSIDKLRGKHLSETSLPRKLRERIHIAMQDAPQTTSFFEVNLEPERYLSGAVSPVHTPENFLEDVTGDGWVIVVQDITHLRDSERNRARFIQTAAHDLRNPLGVALSALNFVKGGIQPAQQEENEVIDMAIASIDHMQHLIDDLLNLEHIQSGVQINRQMIDVRDLLERVMLEVQPAIHYKQQQFKLEVADYIPEIRGDSRWVSRAVVNLLTNANKYTPQGGTIILRGWHDAPANEVIIEVADNGVGIALANRQRIFDTFYREPKIREQVQGTGLGLSIVKSVVEQHNGRIYLNSEEGEGSTFGLALPIETVPE